MVKYLFFVIVLLLFSCSEKKQDSFVLEKTTPKECLIYEYKYKFGKIDTLSKRTIKHIFFNTKGLISEKRDSVYKNIYVYTYTDTLLIEEIIYNFDGDMERKEKYNYNNNIKTDSIFRKDEGLFYVTKHFRDERKRDTLVLSYSSEDNWKLSAKSTNQYDSLGFKYGTGEFFDIYTKHKMKRINDDRYNHVIEEWNVRKEKILVGTTNNVYDIKRRLIKHTSINHRLKNYQQYSIEYNKDGKISVKIYYNESGEPIKRENYIYIY